MSSENNIAKTTLILSIIGIFILLFISNIFEPSQIDISKITIKDLNKKIKIQGTIEKIRSYDTKSKDIFTVLELKDKTGKIEVTLLNSRNKISLNQDQEITIIGRVNQYKNLLQVQAEKITSLESRG